MCFKAIMDIIMPYLTLAAFVVSIWAIINATNNNNKQIRVNKIEEIYELTSSLFYHYPVMKFLFLQWKDFNTSNDPMQKSQLFQEYNTTLKQFKDKVNIDLFSDKTARLKVLANAYLEGDLRLKVLAYNELFNVLIRDSLQGLQIHQETFYREGFPDDLKLFDFLEEIQAEFVKEASMVGSQITTKDVGDYREKIFKNKIGLK